MSEVEYSVLIELDPERTRPDGAVGIPRRPNVHAALRIEVGGWLGIGRGAGEVPF